jgi:predicted nucleic acid-binding protein
VTVLDTSAVIDYLLADGVAPQVEEILEAGAPVAAPDLLVFEVVAVLRREVPRGLSETRARNAIHDLADLAIDLFPALPLRARAFDLRENMTAGDALFVVLAESLGEPLATKDRRLARAAHEHAGVDALLLA